MLTLLADLTERSVAAMVVVTHSDAAAAICHRIIHMKDGRIQGQGR